MGKDIGATKISFVKIFLISFIILVVSFLFSLLIGPSNLNVILTAYDLMTNKEESLLSIIIQIRLPRTLLALFVGGSLSICGAVFQSILINPLAEPYILGISSGAAFGASVSMALGLSFFFSQFFAFIGAIIVMLTVFFVGKKYGELEPNALLLGGVMTGAFFSALILIMLSLISDSFKSAIFWLMGNLSIVRYEYLIYIIPVALISLAYFISNSYQYNLLTLGSISARALGVNAKSLKNFSYFFASLLTASVVSISGVIGFVGLIVPHICRGLFGYDNRIVFPSSFLLGASFLILCDAFARSIIAPVELPVGAVTASLGAPVFVYILRKRLKSFENS